MDARSPAATLLALALCAACGPSLRDISRSLAQRESALPERGDVRRTYWDRAATRPKSETGWLLLGDGTSVKDGVERRWYENGNLEYERHWTRDRPSGLWRSWFESGAQRFEHHHDPERATTMTWWHESGAISSRGDARAGVREGTWRGDHPGGTRAFEGAFVANRRDGFWTFWYPDGSLETSGHYRQGERVGVWENHAPGERPADEAADAQRSEDPPAPGRR
jgi:antitoxin component YwqK of YwqJK toxin-antitoxin module